MIKNKLGQVRSGWVIAALLASVLLIAFILMLICLIILMLVVMRTERLSINLFSAILTDWLWLLITIQCATMIGVSLFSWKKIFKRPLPAMGLKRLHGHGKELLFGLLLGTVSISLVIITSMLWGLIDFSKAISSFDAGLLILYLFVFILVGFSEELFCRGLIMSVLRRTKSKALVIIVSSAVFSLLHIGNPGYTVLPLINIALIGALFGYMFIRSGHIWMPVGYHIMWNYVQGCVFGLNVSGIDFDGMMEIEQQEQLAGSAEFGLEGDIITTVLIFLCFFAVAWFYKGKRYDFFAVETKTMPYIDHKQTQMQI